MTSSSFVYVQGNERLDWGVLVAIDLQRLTKDTNVDTLQRIVENLAFSHITRDEAAMFSADHILHLFKLSQIVIQYLVFSQECLAKLNVRLNENVGELRGAVDILEKAKTKLLDERDVLKKEVKAQRRTLLAYEYNTVAASRGKKHFDAQRTSATPHSSAPPMTFVCSTCGEAYHKAESLQSHMRKRHGAASPRGGAAGAAAGGEASAAPPSSEVVLRYEAELRRMQDRFEHLERQLEKERDAASSQQRDQMMQLLIQQISNFKNSTSENTANSQQQQPPPPQPQPLAALPGAASPPPPRMELPGMSPPRIPPVTHGSVLPKTADSLSTIPVVPDLSAMTEYNLSRQRQTEHATLVRQMHELQKELRDLKHVAHNNVKVEPKPVSNLLTSSPPSVGDKPDPAKPVLSIQQPAAQDKIVGTVPITPPAEAPMKLPTSLPLSPLPHTKTVVQVPYSTIPTQVPAVSTAPIQPTIPLPSSIASPEKATPPILEWMRDSKPQTAAAEGGASAPWRRKEYSISLSSSTSTAPTVRPTDPARSSGGLETVPVSGPASPMNYSFLNSIPSVNATAVVAPITAAAALPIPTPAVTAKATESSPVTPGQPAYMATLGSTPIPNRLTLGVLSQRPDSSDSDSSS